MYLVEPVPHATRSALADWAELTALTSDRRLTSEAGLVSLYDQYADDESLTRVDPETDEIVDEAILQSEQEQYMESIVDEVLYRSKVLRGHYPFTVNSRAILLSFVKSEPELSVGEWVYLFCLLSSAMREARIQPKNPNFEQRIPNLFQICACVAAGGYISGAVSSFGFPRATGTGFLPALTSTYRRFGEGTVRSDDDVPAGFPTDLKDGGIDIIAWRHCPDQLPGKLYMLGQCASGLNWRSKTVKQYLDPFHGIWFRGHPPSDPITAIFIPFTLHHELEARDDISFPELLQNHVTSETYSFGLIQDRLRISYFADMGCKLPDKDEIDLCDNIDDVKSWVVDVLSALRNG